MNKTKHEISQEQLQSYIDGMADQKVNDMIELHLTNCPECRELADQLGKLDKAVNEIEYRSAPDRYFETFASRVASGIAQRKMARKKAPLGGIFDWGGMPIAAAASLVIMLVLSVNLFYSGESSDPGSKDRGPAGRTAKKEVPAAEKKSRASAPSANQDMGPVAAASQAVYEVKTIVICLPSEDWPCPPPEISTAIEIDIPDGS